MIVGGTTLLTGHRWQPWSIFYGNGEQSPLIKPTHLHGSCSYTLHDADPSLSTLSPWKHNVNSGYPSIYGVISPTFPDGVISRTQSTGTSQGSGNLFFPTQEHPVTQSPTFNILSHGVAHASRTSLDDSLSDESRVNSNPGNLSGDLQVFDDLLPFSKSLTNEP